MSESPEKKPRPTGNHLRRMRLDYIGVVVAALIGVGLAAFLKLSETPPPPQPAAVEGPRGWLISVPSFDNQSQQRRCFRIRASGSSPVNVKFYNQFLPQAGGSVIALQIVRGRKTTAGNDCRGFRPDRESYIGAGPGVIWQDSLAAMPGLVNNGIIDPSFDNRRLWRPGESHDYMVTIYPKDSDITPLRNLRLKIIASPRLSDQVGEPRRPVGAASSAVASPPQDRQQPCRAITRPPGVPRPWLQKVIPLSPRSQISVGADSLGNRFRVFLFAEDDASRKTLNRLSLSVAINGNRTEPSQRTSTTVPAKTLIAGRNQIDIKVVGKNLRKQTKAFNGKTDFELKLDIDRAGVCTASQAKLN